MLFTSLCSNTHYHTKGVIAITKNGEKSSVKCEICTKLDSDPTRDLFDFILRKTDRSECLQKLANA